MNYARIRNLTCAIIFIQPLMTCRISYNMHRRKQKQIRARVAKKLTKKNGDMYCVYIYTYIRTFLLATLTHAFEGQEYIATEAALRTATHGNLTPLPYQRHPSAINVWTSTKININCRDACKTRTCPYLHARACGPQV
eukprot:GEMP01072924.1.p1 GENE.GEMP01072924.1~~GEMP01072924.1.p1  ORF type:complete len:138 (-),score=2.27 GEMP01072924.1:85-498(-)